MSLLYSVLFATRSTTNHHPLALDALRHLRVKRADEWRTLFLTEHKEYLGGAKAPDNQFKDFKNHVLHVRDGDWGGAPEACEEWRKRTLRALKEKNWSQAAWAAGVLSHYFVDPIQPFHTHQTEEEGVIHAAVERSYSKSYAIFQSIIEHDLGGYPDVETPSGEDWIKQMVRAGAAISNPHYELVIDHFNLAAAQKNPRSGLDQEIKDVIARLVGYAVSAYARVLDRIIEESGVRPPQRDGDIAAVIAALGAPMKLVLARIEDGKERALVAAQYAEYERTGKVRETLCEDDRTVRALYAAEVLNAPLSSLDARWPREIGSAHGEGAPARPLSRAPAGKPPQPKSKKRAEPRSVVAPPAPEPVIEPPPIPAPAEPAPKVRGRKAASRPPADAPAPEPAPEPASIVHEAPPPSPPPDPAMLEAAAAQPAIELDAAFLLDPTSPIEDAPSIGPKTARRLEAVGVHTVGDLLALAPATGAVLINQRHISAQVIQDWQSQALLACTVAGLKSREAQALVACGVRSPEELAEHPAHELAAAIDAWTRAPQSARIWGNAPAPSEAEIARWIAHARGVIREEEVSAS